MMTGGKPVGSGCRVKTLDIAGSINVDETGEAFSPDRSSTSLMARRDLGDWLPCFENGSLIRYELRSRPQARY